MLNERELHYVEVGDSEEALSPKAPLTKGILSLCLGGLSIILAGLLGIILGVVARRLASPVLLDFGGTAPVYYTVIIQGLTFEAAEELCMNYPNAIMEEERG